MIDVQNIVLEHTGRGVTQEYVYREIVYPTYRISRRTFYSYLRINAKADLKKIRQVEQMQPTLF